MTSPREGAAKWIDKLTRDMKCWHCHGTGRVMFEAEAPNSPFFWEACRACRGTGVVDAKAKR